jgi:hypothetical protein
MHPALELIHQTGSTVNNRGSTHLGRAHGGVNAVKQADSERSIFGNLWITLLQIFRAVKFDLFPRLLPPVSNVSPTHSSLLRRQFMAWNYGREIVVITLSGVLLSSRERAPYCAPSFD